MSNNPSSSFVEPNPIIKRRKVLGEILNIETRTQSSSLKSYSDRRSSMGLNLTSPKKNYRSHIPPPTSLKSSDETKHESENNRKLSRIPLPQTNKPTNKNNHNSINDNNTLDRFSRDFASIKRSLDDKSRIILSRPRHVVENHDNAYLSSNRPQSSSILPVEIERDHKLDQELSELQNKLCDLEQDSVELKRIHKKLQHKLLDVKLEIDKLERKFEFKEESITKNVSNHEKLIDMNLKELSHKYIDEYNEAKFQLENELRISKSYRDESIVKEVTELESKKENLVSQLNSIKKEKHDTLESEKILLQNEISKYLEQKTFEVDELSSIYETKSSELEKLTSKLTDLQNQIKTKNEENEKLESSIREVESSSKNFVSQKSLLQQELEAIYLEIEQVKQEENEWTSKFIKVEKTYNESLNKLSKHNQQKRILENMIMNYEGKLRVYVKVPNSIDIADNEFIINHDSFKFNKVFRNEITNESLISEFIALTKSAITGNNVSMILLGNSTTTINHSLTTDIILKSYQSFTQTLNDIELKSWDFQFNLKSLRIKVDGLVYDNLNESTEIIQSNFTNNLSELPAKSIPIIDDNQLSQMVKQIQTVSNLTTDNLYIININAKNTVSLKQYENNLLLVDITSQSISNQCEILSESQQVLEIYSKLIDYSYCFSKCLHLTSLSKVDDESSIKLLKVLKIINSTDSPYRRK